ncbi:hypothetical protein FRB95_013404 [Tulasnella sp. JGI-2019a]|nr:hypothetical protein FRB95_013404 [Tulasnella sp. JGI-2019a]
MAVLASGGLFCWRLYVIWSRNVRIILIPACLLVVNVIGFSFIVVIDFLLAARPHDQRYISLHVSLYIWVSAVTLAHTAYITICITGRLWWVGNATNKLYGKRRNRYQGAINAIAQNGVIYVVSMVLSIITGAIVNSVMVVVVRRINPSMNGISATLLVLELNMYQDRTQREEDSNLPTITGASIHFAIPQGSFSSISEGWTQSPVVRRRRASIAARQHHEYCKAVADASGQLLATFPTSATPTNNRTLIRTVP